MSNYDDLLREKENNDSFKNVNMEKYWAALNEKLEPTKSPTLKITKTIKYILAVAAVAIVGFFGFKFLKNNKTDAPEIASTTKIESAIKPPLTWANLPYEIFELDATIGDTIFTQNGSIIVFPANALLNNKGEIVKGKVEIKAREFNDAIDYSIAGIPMDYDSAGVKYKFISSAMIDINAYQNNEKLQVNPIAKPILNLVSTNTEKNTNLYKLDTVSGIWQNKGKDVVSYISNTKAIANTNALNEPADAQFYQELKNGDKPAEENFYSEIIKPLPPQQASNKNPIINIEFVPGSFKELAIYDGLKFEVIGKIASTSSNSVIPRKFDKEITSKQTYSIFTDVENNSKIDWENIELKNTDKEGEYKVIFTSGKQSVTYLVKPVLEGIAFAAAEKKYQQKMLEYENVKNKRLQELSKKELDYINKNKKDSLADAQMLAQNNKTKALNKIIEKRNELVEARNKFIEEQNKMIVNAAIEAEKNRKKMELEYAQSDGILRSFTIDGFGYWNCDQPTIPAPIYVSAGYSNSKNELLESTKLHVAVQNVNRLLTSDRYYFPYLTNLQHCVFTFTNNKVYYLSYSQFAKLNITKETKSYNFILNEFVGDKNDYTSLKKILKEGS